jgi:uridine kinase
MSADASKPDRPLVIGIAGPSCSGKSGLARHLCQMLEDRNPAIFPMDAYYRDLSHLPPDEADRRNFDDPEALEWPLLEAHFAALIRGKAVDHPIYNFVRHIREPNVVRVGPAGVVIVEGLFALLRASLRSRYDLSAYLHIDEGVSFARRLERDASERGIEREYVENQWRETVLPMAVEHVIPTRGQADLVLDGEAPLERSAASMLDALDMEV